MVIKNDKALIRQNDSQGRTDQTKENFKILLELFKDGIGERGVAKILDIKAQSLRKYRREGIISLYSSKGLSDLFGIERDFFNGKKPLSENEIEKIKAVMQKLHEERLSNSEESNEENDKADTIEGDDFFLTSLRNNASNKNAFEQYGISELEEIIELLDKNLRLARAKVEILKIVEN